MMDDQGKCGAEKTLTHVIGNHRHINDLAPPRFDWLRYRDRADPLPA